MIKKIEKVEKGFFEWYFKNRINNSEIVGNPVKKFAKLK